MAGNIQADNNGDILVEFDYNNIIVVDPNKTINNEKKIQERLVDHENLVMFVNLETEVLPRTKLAVGGSPKDRIRTISAQRMNFMKPTKDTYLSTGYYDELTGKDATQFQGVNQPKSIVNVDSQGEVYKRNTVADEQNVFDNGLLGITSIEVTTNTSFVPSVRMQLEDVQGKGLFQLGDNSPYAAFFNLPYPQFYLTLKGYYGQAIRYQLNLEKFNCSYNSFSGNYQINLEFRGYKFNILNEISMGHLLATPHMYSQTFSVSNQPVALQTGSASTQLNAKTENVVAGAASNSPNDLVTQITSERGYQKIREVYSEYKAKGLVPENLPELTLVQLMNKLENFENFIINSYPKANLEPLTNIRSYKLLLKQFYDGVRGSNTSWFIKYLNPNAIVLTDDKKIYVFKSNLNQGAIDAAITELQTLIKNYKTQLEANPTLGLKGSAPIKTISEITYDNMTVSDNLAAVDWAKTSTLQTGSADNQAEIRKTYESIFKLTFETNSDGDLVLVKKNAYMFEGEGRFNKLITSIEAQANKKLSDYEAQISADLADRLQDSAVGLGFRPTVRNIVGVIMASAEAFIRLMEDCHSKAWDVKYDPVRKAAILNNAASALGSDTRDNYNITIQSEDAEGGLKNGQVPVYPWPQFFVETNEDKKGRFQLKYIADPSLVDQTQGFLYDKWPEVEFVEEYMRGITQKFNPPLAPPPLDNENQTMLININAIEFPIAGVAYVNKEEVKFFYEIWERQFLTAHYSNLLRAGAGQLDKIIELNVETEFNNIFQSVNISAPYLTLKLKNYKLDAQNYPNFLQTISNDGTGRAYQDYIRDFFVTSYIKNITENSFSILNTTNLGKIPEMSPKSEALEQLIKGDNNKPLIIDTLPFTDPSWVAENMVGSKANVGDLVYETKNTLKVFPARNVISNFTDIYNYTTNRPVTSFSYLSTPLTQPENDNLFGAFYLDRLFSPEKKYPTEGYFSYIDPSANVKLTTTSMLNTPFFVNAIQNGVYNEKRDDVYPYVQAAYLFLNSLPLATLREKYKSYENATTINKDYISSVFKKYGAIHKMPYAWVLKIGSIWHRYKKYVETGNDILDSAWKNFDYVSNYSPVLSSITQTYSFDYSQTPTTITLQQENDQVVTMDVGFYPKVINDFNYFYNGYDYFSGYTNTELQVAINNGMKILTDGKNQIFGVSSNGKILNETTRTVLVPKLSLELQDVNCNPINNTVGDEYFIVPSFGTTLNQVKYDCISDPLSNPTTKVSIASNPNVYNGTVRLLWGAPNYGYFDADQQVKPSPDEYINKFTSAQNNTGFEFLRENEYSKIEEVFSVFEKKILDQMELSFLNFCKPSINIAEEQSITTLYESVVDISANYRNFQALFRSLMSVPAQNKNTGPTLKVNDTEYLKTTIKTQMVNFNNIIKSFLQYDVILRYGNPSNYNRRVFDSYRSYLNTTQYVINPITFNPYVPGTLPTKANPILISNSKALNPAAWAALELEVGFSTISGVTYSSNGSYITDFFVDNNIEFSSQNVTILAPLIKMYATQKLKKPTITPQEFKDRITEYLNGATELQNIFLTNTLARLQKDLPNQQQLPERTIQSVIDGQQSKVELYETFKALNDKWIAGNDYTEKTLFEDMLFLDRASRNIGDIILLDIFELKNMLNQNALNQAMSVYAFIGGILIKNNFTVMNLPAYVNFYNIQDVSKDAVPQPEGSLEFANRMWGTFLDVDYRNSSSKMVCFYVGKPSEYLALSNSDFRFRSDAFDLNRTSDNPLIENQQNKTDWALSNKCVGFSVDIGIRNQNIFYSFSVSQEPGKATSEAINTAINMVNQATGRNTATQNVSLYNLYKNRSYSCTISCLGNALIQPSMYFNLRHVPMFYGPYMIMDVSHSIQPGNFQTTFTGVRQNVFDLPSIDNFLQQVNQNLLTKLQEILVTKKDVPAIPAETDNQKSQDTTQSAEGKKAAQNSCSAKLNPYYAEKTGAEAYISKETVVSGITPYELATAIKSKAAEVPLRLIIYAICYIRTYRADNNNEVGKFYGFDNNYATVTLEDQLNPSDSYFLKTYSCVDIKQNKSVPVANFASLDVFLDFMVARLIQVVPLIQQIGLQKYYVCFWPVNKVSIDYFDAYPSEFAQVKANMYKAIESAIKVGVCTEQEAKTFGYAINENSQPPSVTPTPSPIPGQVCPPPRIDSFSPTTGATNQIVQVNGVNLLSTTEITIGNIKVNMELTEIFNDETLRFSVPDFPNPAVQSGKIQVKTKFGTATSQNDFKHI